MPPILSHHRRRGGGGGGGRGRGGGGGQSLADVASHSVLGARDAQQDRLAVRTVALPPALVARIAAVFDGHGAPHDGHLVADLLRDEFLPALLATPAWTRAAAAIAAAAASGGGNDGDDVGGVAIAAAVAAGGNGVAAATTTTAAAAATATGSKASAIADHVRKDVQRALADAAHEMEARAAVLSREKRTFAGSTLCAVVAVAEARDQGRVLALFSANVGDSRAVVAVGEWGGPALRARALTSDHVPDRPDELARLTRAGGWVVNGKLNSYVSMSRAIGDFELKHFRNDPGRFPPPPPHFLPPQHPTGERFTPELFIATPEVAHHAVAEDTHFCIIASDGLWHVMTNEQAVATVYRLLRRGKSFKSAAKRLVKRHQTGDNVTAVIIPLSHDSVGTRTASFSSSVNTLGSRGTSSGDPSVHGATELALAVENEKNVTGSLTTGAVLCDAPEIGTDMLAVNDAFEPLAPLRPVQDGEADQAVYSQSTGEPYTAKQPRHIGRPKNGNVWSRKFMFMRKRSVKEAADLDDNDESLHGGELYRGSDVVDSSDPRLPLAEQPHVVSDTTLLPVAKSDAASTPAESEIALRAGTNR